MTVEEERERTKNKDGKGRKVVKSCTEMGRSEKRKLHLIMSFFAVRVSKKLSISTIIKQMNVSIAFSFHGEIQHLFHIKYVAHGTFWNCIVAAVESGSKDQC